MKSRKENRCPTTKTVKQVKYKTIKRGRQKEYGKVIVQMENQRLREAIKSQNGKVSGNGITKKES